MTPLRSSSAGGGIPKVIHFMWFSPDDDNVSSYPKERYSKFVESWKTHHPDFEFKFWYNRDILNLWTDPFLRPFKDLYEKMLLIEKCDFTRYAIMYLFGGVYVDLNTMCHRNIGELIHNRELVLSPEPQEHNVLWNNELVTNSFLASAPGQSFWIEFMRHISRNYWNWTEGNSKKHLVLINTGPAALGRFATQYFGKQSSVFVDVCQVQPLYRKGNASLTSEQCKGPHIPQPYCAKHWQFSAGWGNGWNSLQQQKRAYIWALVILLLLVVLLIAVFSSKAREKRY